MLILTQEGHVELENQLQTELDGAATQLSEAHKQLATQQVRLWAHSYGAIASTLVQHVSHH
jgi:hypothetical protein